MHEQVDVLLATYQGGAYLKEQLQSLIQQSYPHFQIFVRDDGSTDDTVPIIEEFRQLHPNKISVIASKDRLGAKGNFSALMAYAKAPYVMFCDQDDVWKQDKIEITLLKMKELETQTSSTIPLLVHTDTYVVDQALKMMSTSLWKYSKLKPLLAHSLCRLLCHNVVTGCTMMINQPLLKLASFIPTAAIMHDWWLALLAHCFGKIDHLNTSTMFYRQHGKNDTGAVNWNKISTSYRYIKKAFQFSAREEMRFKIARPIKQAEQFLIQYEGRLNPHNKYLIEQFVQLGKEGIFKKRYLFLKHNFYKNTLAKSIGMFLLL